MVAIKSKSIIKTSKREIKAIILVLILSIVFLIGNGPTSFTPILIYLGVDKNFYDIYLLITNFLTWLTHGSNFFIYISFNQEFRETFLKIIQLKK